MLYVVTQRERYKKNNKRLCHKNGLMIGEDRLLNKGGRKVVIKILVRLFL